MEDRQGGTARRFQMRPFTFIRKPQASGDQVRWPSEAASFLQLMAGSFPSGRLIP